MAEGVGFEPTVGFPTLDFESSALNRTQPPFLEAQENGEPQTSNIQRRMQLCPILAFGVQLGRSSVRSEECRRAQRGGSKRRQTRQGTGALLSEKCYNFMLAMPTARAAYCMSAGEPRYYLLLTGIHSLLAPLFTSIHSLFRTSTLPHRHDSTKTWNSARFT